MIIEAYGAGKILYGLPTGMISVRSRAMTGAFSLRIFMAPNGGI
jgi:hypothetical protein